MNYGQLRDHALALINQYTRAGSTYALTYNNQADYVNKIPFLINEGLIYLCSSVRPMAASAELDPSQGEAYGQWRRYLLPEDFISMRTGGLFIPEKQRYAGDREYLETYRIQEPDYILLPIHFDKVCVLDYFRRPQLLSADPTEDTRIDAPIDVQNALIYYVAYHLVLDDNSFKYASLQNEFENIVARLSHPQTTEIRPVTDVYAMGVGEEDWY